MLSRVAESLYWIGRYIERSEHALRYLKVHYFSTLDAPMSQNKEFIFRSILFISGSDFNTQSSVSEKDVWDKVIFDHTNPGSVFSLCQYARENARSIRTNISYEFWEAINCWYLYNKKISNCPFDSGMISKFSAETKTHFANVKYTMHETLLHDDSWRFINLGINLERCLQVLRLVKCKIQDTSILSENGTNQILLQYQWTILLRTLEAFDISKGMSKGFLDKESIFALVLENDAFPRSLKHSTDQMLRFFKSISVCPEGFYKALDEIHHKIDNQYIYLNYENEDVLLDNIDNYSQVITNFHNTIQKIYFSQ